LTYTYDAGGHRTSVGGSLANVSIPATALGGSYDANNRLSQLNGSTLTYDGNGNSTTDGTNSYSWDARNQLASVSGPVNASFQYDAVGRRVQKTIGSITTGYLYDGSNFVQEQNAAGAPTATLLTGGVDQIFARMTSVGISVPMTDALGSVIGETNPAQSVTKSVAYEPYGTTTQSGTNTGNSQQYAGRENDGTGLYYNRARYYNPALGRFISEDPIGFSGGTNVYAYASGNPVSKSDPLGLWTGQLGLSLSLNWTVAGIGIGWTGSFGVAIDGSGNIALYKTGGAGGALGTPGFSGGVQAAVTGGDTTVCDLVGPFNLGNWITRTIRARCWLDARSGTRRFGI
jgi:RHS repeat-associated protein